MALPRMAGVAWFSLSSIICLYDALFVLLRPRTLPGGDLHYIWTPYAIYIEVDKIYGDVNDEFCLAQSWMNLVEIVLNLATVTLLLRGNKGAILSGFTVSVMTFWKTVLYMLQYVSLCNGAHRVAHMDWPTFIFIFLATNGVWIVVPFLFMFSYGSRLLAIIQSHKDKKQ